MDGEADLYQSYIEFKNWTAPSEALAPQYQALLPRLRAGQRVLEVGFGDGSLLKWLRDSGAEVVGVEIIPELVEFARKNGFEAHTSMETVVGPFDWIVMVDVLEHLTISQLAALLKEAAKLFSPGATLVARFPNGASPFSTYYQTGDATHLKPLAPDALSQVAIGSGLELVSARNARYKPRRAVRRLQTILVHGLRDIFQLVIGLTYYGRSFPMDANVIVELRAHNKD